MLMRNVCSISHLEQSFKTQNERSIAKPYKCTDTHKLYI